MFQSFSGSSRRPRQVNLSGQNANPFSASSWIPTASGTQRTVAAAQHERQQRQRERDRLNAAKQLQRTWRGHRARKSLAERRRASWDELDAGAAACPQDVLVREARLLVAFYNSQREDDRQRMVKFATRVLNGDPTAFLSDPTLQPRLQKLAAVTLLAADSATGHSAEALLRLLTAMMDAKPHIVLQIASKYFSLLSTSMVYATVELRPFLFAAANHPFTSLNDGSHAANLTTALCRAYAFNFLTTPHLIQSDAESQQIASSVDVDVLSDILVAALPTATLSREQQPWLLANLIAIHQVQKGSVQEPSYLRTISILLSQSADEILTRRGAPEPEVVDEDVDGDVKAFSPLPSFVADALASLVNQESISGLLTRFNIDYNKYDGGQEEATALANYALMLLRIFPSRGDEIRMWLYMGSMNDPTTGSSLPAVKFFWLAMKSSESFSTIRSDPKGALALLRRTPTSSTSPSGTDREWGLILLFLELYNFVLRFTDDEEFLSGGVMAALNAGQSTSRFRESALPLEDVQLLTTFLKNLAFTMYYSTAELFKDDAPKTDGVLSAYFGHAPPRSQTSTELLEPSRSDDRLLAGIWGMKFNYVRDIVTGVMRMLYERDSRRRFLPKDHWLMTSQFDMEGFIPAVVMEEERQHEVAEDEDEEDDEDDSAFLGIIGMQQSRRARHIEQVRRTQQQSARKKVLAMIGPRLEVLQHMPFVIPFETRVRIFRQFVLLDQMRRRNGQIEPEMWRMSMVQQAMASTHGPLHGGFNPREVLGRHHANIHRDNVFEDAFKQFYRLGDGLKEPIQITFVDQFDTVEAGIDGGGVTKEFLTSVTNEAFGATGELSLFVSNEQNLLYPNPSSLDAQKELLRISGLPETSAEWSNDVKDYLKRYEFLGRIIGKCLYEGILVDISFAGFFLLKWASAGPSGADSYRANINDLRDLDESLYQGLLRLKNYPGNVEDFALDFSITDTVSMPNEPTRTINRELLPGGSNITVNNENRPLYVSCVARHRLQVQPFQQTQAFLRGLRDIIKPSWLSMFNQSELQTLISGEQSQIDVEDLRQNTSYGGVYVIGDDGFEHPTVTLFWQVMHDLEDAERRKVLKYVTSTPRAPLLGFSQLNPRFSIRDAGNDESRLPSTSTCVNLLKLPRYTTAATLRDKLLYAVNSGAGFDLS